nr:hypothetical protein [uncultured Deefgea sp.]
MARLEKLGVLEKIRVQYGMSLNETPRPSLEPTAFKDPNNARALPR